MFTTSCRRPEGWSFPERRVNPWVEMAYAQDEVLWQLVSLPLYRLVERGLGLMETEPKIL